MPAHRGGRLPLRGGAGVRRCPTSWLLATDGYGNSFADGDWWHGLVDDLASYAASAGFDALESGLPTWLADSAEVGGDDVTAVLLVREPLAVDPHTARPAPQRPPAAAADPPVGTRTGGLVARTRELPPGAGEVVPPARRRRAALAVLGVVAVVATVLVAVRLVGASGSPQQEQPAPTTPVTSSTSSPSSRSGGRGSTPADPEGPGGGGAGQGTGKGSGAPGPRPDKDPGADGAGPGDAQDPGSTEDDAPPAPDGPGLG